MGQQDVLNVLNQKQDFMTAEEISEICDSAYGCVIRALKVMLKYGEVERQITEEKLYNTRKVYIWRAVINDK